MKLYVSMEETYTIHVWEADNNGKRYGVPLDVPADIVLNYISAKKKLDAAASIIEGLYRNRK